VKSLYIKVLRAKRASGASAAGVNPLEITSVSESIRPRPQTAGGPARARYVHARGVRGAVDKSTAAR